MPFFCAVPPTLPVDPEGVSTFAAAGPYYAAEHVVGQRLMLARNRRYGGKRPHHVDRYLVDFASSPKEVLDRIEQGQSDWGYVGPSNYLDATRNLAGRYGVNRSQFFVKPGLGVRFFAMNMSRPLFRNNPKLRKALNFAVDRAALQRVLGGPLAGQLTDQYLPPGMPGYRNAHIYPFHPNLARARKLARGHLRSRKATLYVINTPPEIALAQIFKENAARIGLAVELEPIPPASFFTRIGVRSEPYDIVSTIWATDYVDPYGYIDLLLDGRALKEVGNANLAQLDSPQLQPSHEPSGPPAR